MIARIALFSLVVPLVIGISLVSESSVRYPEPNTGKVSMRFNGTNAIFRVSVFKVSRVAPEEVVDHWLAHDTGIGAANPVKISTMFQSFFGDKFVDVDQNGDACMGYFHRAEICLKAHFCVVPLTDAVEARIPISWAGEYAAEVTEVSEMRHDDRCIAVGAEGLDVLPYDGQAKNLITRRAISAFSQSFTVEFADEVSAWFAAAHDLRPAKSWMAFFQDSFLQAPVGGQVLEFGVASGRSLAFLGQILEAHPEMEGVTAIGFDSFRGLPVKWGKYDAHLFDQGGVPPPVIFNYDRVDIRVGWFNETLPTVAKAPVSFLHIDSDLFESAVEIFDALSCLFVEGTVIVMDELFNLQGTYGNETVAWWRTGEYSALELAKKKFGFEYQFLDIFYEQAVAARITKVPSNMRECEEAERSFAPRRQEAAVVERNGTGASLEKLASLYGYQLDMSGFTREQLIETVRGIVRNGSV